MRTIFNWDEFNPTDCTRGQVREWLEAQGIDPDCVVALYATSDGSYIVETVDDDVPSEVQR